jgi:DNA anti-recombination protein RmuC
MQTMTRETWTDERLDEFAKRIDERFDRVDERFDEVDAKFAQVDKRFEQVDKRFEQIDKRFEAMQVAMATGFEAVNRNMFIALVGICSVMITGFIGIATQI